MSSPEAEPTPSDAPVIAAHDHDATGALVVDELVIEEISIDGMCGVY